MKNNILVYVALIVAVAALVFSYYGGKDVGLAPDCPPVGSDYEISDFRKIFAYNLVVGGALSNPSQTFNLDGTTYTIELVAGSDTESTLKLTQSSTGRYEQKSIIELSSSRILGFEVGVIESDESTALNIIEAKGYIGTLPVCLR